MPAPCAFPSRQRTAHSNGQATEDGSKIKLDPMNSYERRLVHNLLKDDPTIRSWSPEDSGRLKRITLLPRQNTLS